MMGEPIPIRAEMRGFVRLAERATRYDLAFFPYRMNGIPYYAICLLNWGPSAGIMTLPIEADGWIHAPFPSYIDEKMGIGEVGAEALHRFMNEHGEKIKEVANGKADYFFYQGP